MNHPTQGQSVSTAELDGLSTLLRVAWGNIQHNELLRNNLFGLYLFLAGGFFAVSRFTTLSGSTRDLGIATAMLIGLTGLVFMWVFVRLRMMIDRDNKIIHAVHDRMHELDGLAKVVEVYAEYQQASARFLRRASVTHAFIFATGLVSAGVVSLGIDRLMIGDGFIEVALFAAPFLVAVGVYITLVQLMVGDT